MRRIRYILLLGVALAGAAAAEAPVSAAHGRLHPMLRLITRAPLTVRGSGFRPRSRITVIDGVQRVRIHSSAQGRFTATFSASDRCSAIRVVATGPNGEHAVLRLPPPMCPPA